MSVVVTELPLGHMNGFDVAAIWIAVAAVSGHVNHRLLRLPATSGTLVVALVSFLVLIAVNAVVPSIGLTPRVARS
jgi:hypothetical protein